MAMLSADTVFRISFFFQKKFENTSDAAYHIQLHKNIKTVHCKHKYMQSYSKLIIRFILVYLMFVNTGVTVHITKIRF